MSGVDKGELIRSVDILKVCDELGIKVRRVGRGYKALCPFHEEKIASFSIDPVKKLFKCFGCGKGGDVIRLVEGVKKVSFKEALRYLEGLFGGVSPHSLVKTQNRG